MQTRLVLIEGLPGSGKSTTIEGLKSSGITRIASRTEFYDEYDNPLNAFWTWGDGWREDEVMEAPYDSRRFLARLLERTYKLVDRVLETDTLVVMEGYPTHLTVRNMLKMSASRNECRMLFQRFAQAVADIDPLLVILDTPDWAARIRQVEEERGAAFSNIFFDSLQRTPYGRSRGIQTRKDVLEFYEECNAFSLDLLDEWPHSSCCFDPFTLGRQATIDRIVAAVSNSQPGSPHQRLQVTK